MNLTYASVCSGIEAPSVAWHSLGWKPLWFSEIEPFPCALLKERYPTVPNLGDMTLLEQRDDLPVPDVFIGGTPCFPKGTLVLTQRGLLDISEVVRGDQVLTHKGRYQRVVRTGRKIASTWRLKGQGVSELITTEEHPFYARSMGRKWNNTRRAYDRVPEKPSWTKASELKDSFWASPEGFPSLPVPPVMPAGNELPVPGEGSADFWWLVGFWLGNGWTRIEARHSFVLLSDAREDIGVVEQKVAAIGLHSSATEDTAVRLQVGNSAWARWLDENFGCYSDGKQFPAWVLGMETVARQSFLDGYLYADGHDTANGAGFTTVNKRVVMGIRLLAQSLGSSVSVHRHMPEEHKVIQGRVVNQQPWYRGSIYKKARSAFAEGGFWWGRVRRSELTGRVEEVFNLEVEEDNSYTADGQVVHNCQAFSTAGLRGGLEDARGNLALVFCRLVGKLRPQWVIWENVPGVLSIDGGRAFGSILGGLAEFGYGWSYRVLDAQFIGGCDLHVQERGRGPVPQRRRRVFVVAHSGGDWRLPAEVLALGEGVLRDLAARKPARKKAARDTAAGAGERRVAHTLSAEGADASEDGTGRGTPLVTGTLCCNSKAAGSATSQDAESGLLVPQIAGTLGSASQTGGYRTTDLDNNGAFIPEKAEALGVAFSTVGFDPTGSKNNAEKDLMPTLRAGVHGSAGHHAGVAFSITPDGGQEADLSAVPTEVAGAVTVTEFAKATDRGTRVVMPFDPVQVTHPENRSQPDFGRECHCLAKDNAQRAAIVEAQDNLVVRRLTPLECERLQGFPDWYTAIPLAKPRAVDAEEAEYCAAHGIDARRIAADSLRYKALGNSMAVPCIRLLGTGIERVMSGVDGRVSAATETTP